ncbi:MAG: helix-turn-helix domain-containing protein [Acidimicrobiia bacterium]|nr:helix-turn-helix domain-containing protein [Acidimicrobiia bacterium]
MLDTGMVAELLGMNIQVVRRMAREGEIPSYRLPGGRTFRFFRDEIFQWLRRYPVHRTADEAASATTVADG